MELREFKDIIYGDFPKIGKALSSAKRLEILDLLSQSPKSVENLAKETKMSVANTSKHLQALLEARLVIFNKEKNFVIYQLASQHVVDLLSSIKRVAEEQIAEVNILRNEFIVKPDHVETISPEEWSKIKNNENHILIDVRPEIEFQSGHINNALSIPINELIDNLIRLPKDKDIIAYCRGPYCIYATEAVELLQSKGYKAYRLEAGIHEWNQLH